MAQELILGKHIGWKREVWQPDLVVLENIAETGLIGEP